MGSFRAELLLLRKRAATWILLAIAVLLSLLFPYVLPYSSYLSQPATQRTAADLQAMLPQSLVSGVLGGFPFYFGTLTLILGALLFGSEYGWGTLKTTLMQHPSRLRLLTAKLAALGAMLALFTSSIFAVGASGSYLVAVREGAAVSWPPLWDLARGVGAGWLLLALWALFGVVLAVLSRGTALAIGLGIVYGLVGRGLHQRLRQEHPAAPGPRPSIPAHQRLLADRPASHHRGGGGRAGGLLRSLRDHLAGVAGHHRVRGRLRRHLGGAAAATGCHLTNRVGVTPAAVHARTFPTTTIQGRKR